MQKQKTIAKWLAVILLVTVAVACYIVLNALLPSEQNPPQNIAGADSIDGNDDIDGKDKTDNTQTIKPTPVYSTLPRKNERVKNIDVAHIGGEAEDNLLDAVYFYGKTLVIFKTQSTQYDVKQSGIYIAAIDGMTLEKVAYIAPITHTYLGCTQTSNGVLVATSNEEKSTLYLYDKNLSLKCQSDIPFAKEIFFGQDLKTTEIFTYDGESLKHAYLDGELNATFANFLFQATQFELVQLVKYGTSTLLFCNVDNSATVLSYSQKTGFIRQKQYDKQSIVQVLPISQNGQQAFVTLLKTNDEYTLSSLLSDFSESARYALPSVKNACVFQGETGIEIIADNNVICLCSHLEFISKSSLGIKENSYGVNADIFENISSISSPIGANNYLLLIADKRCILLKKDDNVLGVVTAFSTYRAPLVFTGVDDLNQSYMRIAFECDNSNDFSYMCFGKSDVFLISLLTT